MGWRTKENGDRTAGWDKGPSPDVPGGRARSPREMEDGSCSDLEDEERADLVQMGGGEVLAIKGLATLVPWLEGPNEPPDSFKSRIPAAHFFISLFTLLLPAVSGPFFCLGSVTEPPGPTLCPRTGR